MSPVLSHTPAILDQDSFQAIAELAYKESGLTLTKGKSAMIQSRLRHRLHALGLDEFSQYSAFVSSEQGLPERRQLISALTTNVSHFFREAHHFEQLNKLLPTRIQRANEAERMRIWSAGCSRGQEPLSIAMNVLENLPACASGDFRILATDIDSAVIRFAQRGTYPERMIKGADRLLKEKYFQPGTPKNGEPTFVAKANLRELIRYNALNLLAPWPIKSKFDAIFCRNVVIYFDVATQEILWPRFRLALKADGLLFLGHSERIAEPERFGFECIAPTTYRPLPD